MTAETIRCKAAVAWKVNEPLSIETIEVSPPAAGEVRIKIIASGVCGTDLSSLKGKNGISIFPSILGHEGGGIVESIGEGVKNLCVGDHVIPTYMGMCGECPTCSSGVTNICMVVQMPQKKGTMMDGTTRFKANGKTIYHYMGISSFSEYTVINVLSVAKVDKEAPLNRVCMFGCAISTGYGAVVNNAKVTKGSSCVVFGLGTVGLAAIMGCKIAGASKIIGVDINSAKFEAAKQFGATDCLNSKDLEMPVQHAIAGMTQGGVQFAFECVGNSHVMASALESCVVGNGKCVIIGLDEEGSKIQVDQMQMLLGKTMTGTGFGGWNVKDIPNIVELYLEGTLKADEFVTSELSLKDINTAFDIIKRGDGIHTIINF